MASPDACDACIAWAIEMLEEGRDSPSLRMLASFGRGANSFEVQSYLDAASEEIGLAPRALCDAATRCAVATIRAMRAGQLPLAEAMQCLSDLFREDVGTGRLADLYQLNLALRDLEYGGPSPYWWEATRENISGIIERCADEFLRDHAT